MKADAVQPEDVLTYGMGYNAQRYSTLNQVNKGNVGKMVPVWNLSLDNSSNASTQPRVIDGVTYVATHNATLAIDGVTGSYDPDLDLVYWGTGNGRPWNVAMRGGDSLYVCSVLAIRPKTGEIVWHYPFSPGDPYNYDSVNELVLADIKIDGARSGYPGPWQTHLYRQLRPLPRPEHGQHRRRVFRSPHVPGGRQAALI